MPTTEQSTSIPALWKQYFGRSTVLMGLCWWLSNQESPANAGDMGSIPGFGRSLEEGTATHSSILAWRIPWTEEPGRLQPMGWQKSQIPLSG